jgi:hypothetical protein
VNRRILPESARDRYNQLVLLEGRVIADVGQPQSSPLVETPITDRGGAIAFGDDHSAWVVGPSAEGNRAAILQLCCPSRVSLWTGRQCPVSHTVTAICPDGAGRDGNSCRGASTCPPGFQLKGGLCYSHDNRAFSILAATAAPPTELKS